MLFVVSEIVNGVAVNCLLQYKTALKVRSAGNFFFVVYESVNGCEHRSRHLKTSEHVKK